MIARRLGYVALGLVIAASGVYLFVYLYRWEWNRALIAGVILVIAEIALVAAMLMERLTSLDKRLHDLEGGHDDPLESIKRTAPSPRSRFKWLAGDGDLHVFVPVLMGAGVLFAGIAWVVERFARLTARPALEQGLALRLTPLALPEGSLTAPLVELPPEPKAWIKKYRTPILLVALTAFLSISIDALGDLTQNRPDARSVGGSGVISLEIERNGFQRPTLEAAHSLWAACNGTLPRRHEATSIDILSGGTVLVVIEPAPGPSAQRRLHGCFADATIDNLQARVVDISITR